MPRLASGGSCTGRSSGTLRGRRFRNSLRPRLCALARAPTLREARRGGAKRAARRAGGGDGAVHVLVPVVGPVGRDEIVHVARPATHMSAGGGRRRAEEGRRGRRVGGNASVGSLGGERVGGWKGDAPGALEAAFAGGDRHAGVREPRREGVGACGRRRRRSRCVNRDFSECRRRAGRRRSARRSAPCPPVMDPPRAPTTTGWPESRRWTRERKPRREDCVRGRGGSCGFRPDVAAGRGGEGEGCQVGPRGRGARADGEGVRGRIVGCGREEKKAEAGMPPQQRAPRRSLLCRGGAAGG